MAAHILATLRVRSIRLCTNNPRKVHDLEKHGVSLIERVPLEVEPDEYNRFYLATKVLKSGHLSPDGKARLLEQDDGPMVRGISPDLRSALLEELEIGISPAASAAD